MSRRYFICISHLKIQNANALSSPFTLGFPAMTAWLGAVHALERKLHQYPEYQSIHFSGVAVSCHDHQLQTHKGPGDFVHSIIGTSNPLDKDGKRPSFIEEARGHFDVSILLECPARPDEDDEGKNLCRQIEELLYQMKVASGDVRTVRAVHYVEPVDEESEDASYKPILRALMPGYILLERRDLMTQSMNEGLDALDALLAHLKVDVCPEIQEDSEQQEQRKVSWSIRRKKHGPEQNYTGWLVPIAVGFHGISELGQVQNQRDPLVTHRFAESLVTLGEFVMPSQLGSRHDGLGRNLALDDILWRYRPYTAAEPDLYVCTTHTA